MRLFLHVFVEEECLYLFHNAILLVHFIFLFSFPFV